MYNLAFNFQIFILGLRKNIRYSIMFLPLVTIILFPFFSFLSSYIYSFTLGKQLGVINTISQKITDVTINVDQKKFVDLKNDKRLFMSRINNRDNLKYGFRKIFYNVKFFDENNLEVDIDKTKYQNFILPKETFFITHFATPKAVKMDLEFLIAESDLVNILPDELAKYDRTVAGLNNLSIDISNDETFNLNFLIDNLYSKTLNNLKYEYALTNSQGEYLYVGNLVFSQVLNIDKSPKSVNNLSYPVKILKTDLVYIKDNNKLRYNFFEE